MRRRLAALACLTLEWSCWLIRHADGCALLNNRIYYRLFRIAGFDKERESS
jgi:hypothetical protein